jgi:myo-inositol-1-phosphate synthase
MQLNQSEVLRLAIVGVGNNTAALVQGVRLYSAGAVHEPRAAWTPLARRTVFVAAFDIDDEKVGYPLDQAIFRGQNNHPRYQGFESVDRSPAVRPGIRVSADGDSSRDRVTNDLRQLGAEIVILSLPAGMGGIAKAYAGAALDAGASVINCSPDVVARDAALEDAFARSGLVIAGDDLASQFGSSFVHAALLRLMRERGVQPESSYQLNLGGNEDFRNLREHPNEKLESKLNVLRDVAGTSELSVIPSAGHVPHLGDRKVAHINLVGTGWAGASLSIDLKLDVLDSANAAAVIFDLVGVVEAEIRAGGSGFPSAAVPLLKSPARQAMQGEGGT